MARGNRLRRGVRARQARFTFPPDRATSATVSVRQLLPARNHRHWKGRRTISTSSRLSAKQDRPWRTRAPEPFLSALNAPPGVEWQKTAHQGNALKEEAFEPLCGSWASGCVVAHLGRTPVSPAPPLGCDHESSRTIRGAIRIAPTGAVSALVPGHPGPVGCTRLDYRFLPAPESPKRPFTGTRRGAFSTSRRSGSTCDTRCTEATCWRDGPQTPVLVKAVEAASPRLCGLNERTSLLSRGVRAGWPSVTSPRSKERLPPSSHRTGVEASAIMTQAEAAEPRLAAHTDGLGEQNAPRVLSIWRSR
jgi:hypothetical protein